MAEVHRQITPPEPPQEINAPKGRRRHSVDKFTNKRKPSNYFYALHQHRMDSFKNWPPDHCMSSEDLADAGFYYEGHDDCVLCFCCNGGIQAWNPGDDALIDHIWWHPQCQFVIGRKGQAFVDFLINLETNEKPPTLEQVREAMRKNGTDPDLVNNALTRDAAVRSLVYHGIPETDVVKAAEQLKQRGESLSADLLLRRVRHNQGYAEEDAEVSESLDDAHKLKNDIIEMRRRLRCKICLENEIFKVFIPCGHFVSCNDCSLTVQTCPVCRSPIDGTVQPIFNE